MNLRTSFSYLPEIVKNLLIINGLFFLATYVLGSSFNLDLVKHLGLHQFQSPNFRPHQLVTHMFMHGSIGHLLFNMFALWMFGNQLENIWGSKRFLTYYLLTGLGAAALHLAVSQFQISITEAQMSAQQINAVISEGYNALQSFPYTYGRRFRSSIRITSCLRNAFSKYYHLPLFCYSSKSKVLRYFLRNRRTVLRNTKQSW